MKNIETIKQLTLLRELLIKGRDESRKVTNDYSAKIRELDKVITEEDKQMLQEQQAVEAAWEIVSTPSITSSNLPAVLNPQKAKK